MQELTDTTWRIIRGLREGPVDATYTQKIAAQQAREDELQKRDNGYWESVLVSNRQRGETAAHLLEYWSLHASLTPKRVHDAAQRYLDPKRYVQVTLLPAKSEAATSP